MPDTSRDAKQRYYGRPDVVADYDAWRFGSAGGRRIDRRELDAVLAMLADQPRDARVLDLPVGTGRLAARLTGEGFSRVTGADVSAAMLEAAGRRCGPRVSLSRQDAFKTGFASGTFEVIVSLRFFFHHRDAGPLLAEARRLLAPGGLLIFDTLRWSPRAWLAPLQERLGGVVWPQPDEAIRANLSAHGFTVAASEHLHLLPSMAYSYVPWPLLGPLDALERALPETFRSKTLWKAVA